jgi:NAD(P)H-dependent FMN reductase
LSQGKGCESAILIALFILYISIDGRTYACVGKFYGFFLRMYKLALSTTVIDQTSEMKRILTFGASSSLKSINKRLAHHVATLVPDGEVHLIDLNDFEMPIYSIDREADGIPAAALRFKKHIDESDGIIISFAEHNGTYTAAFKNILDWISRIERKVWAEKPMLIMATSPGGNGAATVLEAAAVGLPYLGAHVVAKMSVPNFGEVFGEQGIKDEQMNEKFKALAAQLSKAPQEN